MAENPFKTPEKQARLKELKAKEAEPVQTEPVQNPFKTPEKQARLEELKTNPENQAIIRQEELKTADETLWPDFASVKRGLVGMTPEEQQRSIVSSNPDRYEAVTRPVDESEKEEFLFPNFVYADTEHGIYDKETGKVFSLNRPGYTSADTKELVLGEIPYVVAAMVMPGGGTAASSQRWLRKAGRFAAMTGNMALTNTAMQNLNMLMQGRQNFSYPEFLALTASNVVGPYVAEKGMKYGKIGLDKIGVYDPIAKGWNKLEDKVVNSNIVQALNEKKYNITNGVEDSLHFVTDNVKEALSKLGIGFNATSEEQINARLSKKAARAAKLDNEQFASEKIPPFKYNQMLREFVDNVNDPDKASGIRTPAERAFYDDSLLDGNNLTVDPRTATTDSGIYVRPETRDLIKQEQKLAENYPEAMGSFYDKRNKIMNEIQGNPTFTPSLRPQNSFEGRMNDLENQPIRRNSFNKILDEATALKLKRLKRENKTKIDDARKSKDPAKIAEAERAADISENELVYEAIITKTEFKEDYNKYIKEFIKKYNEISSVDLVSPGDFELLDKQSEAALYNLLEKYGVPKERFKEFDPVSLGIMTETRFNARAPLSSLGFDKSLSDYQDQLPDIPSSDDIRSGENLQKTIEAVSDFNKDRSSTLYNKYAKAYGPSEPTYEGLVELIKDLDLPFTDGPIPRQIFEEALKSGNFDSDDLLEKWKNKVKGTRDKNSKIVDLSLIKDAKDFINAFNFYIELNKSNGLTPLIIDKIKPTKTINNSVYEGPAYPILVQFEKILEPELTIAQRREIENILPDKVSDEIDKYKLRDKEVPPRAILEENIRQQLIKEAKKEAPNKPLSAIEDAHRFLKTQIEQTYEDNTPQIRKVLEPVLEEFEENMDKPLTHKNVRSELGEKLETYSFPQVYRLVKPYLNDNEEKEGLEYLLKEWESSNDTVGRFASEQVAKERLTEIIDNNDFNEKIYEDLELFATLKGDTKDIRKAFAFYKEKFGDKEVLTKVADALKKGQMGTEDIMKLLTASNGEPKFGEKVVDTIVKTPMVRESLGDYIRLTTLIDKNGNIRTGQEMLDKWNSVKKIKGLDKILADNPEKNLGARKDINALEKEVRNQASLNIARKKGKTAKDKEDMSLGEAGQELFNAVLPYNMSARLFRAAKRLYLGKLKSNEEKKELQEYLLKTYHGTNYVPFTETYNASDFTKATTRGLGAYAVKPDLSDEEEDE